jgi:hypothetical protein
MDKRIVRQTLLYAAVLTFAVLLAEWVGVLDGLERYWYDQRARHFQFFTPPPNDRIVHINIDDPTLKEMGWWPWRRAVLAEIVDELHLAGAKVIGFDVLFNEPQPIRYEKRPDGTYDDIDDDARFAQAIASARNVLLPISAKADTAGASNPPEVIEQLQRYTLALPPKLPSVLVAESELPMVRQLVDAIAYSGVVEFTPDADGVIRQVPLFVKWRGRLMPHMALASYCALMGVDPKSLTVTADTLTIPLKAGNQIVPLHSFHAGPPGTLGLFVDVPWFGNPGERLGRRCTTFRITPTTRSSKSRCSVSGPSIFPSQSWPGTTGKLMTRCCRRTSIIRSGRACRASGKLPTTSPSRLRSAMGTD